MELKGERIIPAPVATTWEALNDPEVLKACIAGCESLERTGDNAFVAVVAMKVGPVSARFRGNLQMTNVEAPQRYTINFDGQGGAAGFGKGSADVALLPEGDAGEQTRLAYVAKAQIGGKLAQVGSRLVEAAAGKIANDFFKAFEANLQARRDANADARSQSPQARAGAVSPPSSEGGSHGLAVPPARPGGSPGGLEWGLAAAVVLGTLFLLMR